MRLILQALDERGRQVFPARVEHAGDGDELVELIVNLKELARDAETVRVLYLPGNGEHPQWVETITQRSRP